MDLLKNGTASINLSDCPISLYRKCYGFIVDHLSRNIGNADFSFDGYSTPIGELCNQFFNQTTRKPWFIEDNDKKSYANYLDYARNVYGASLSVSNLNERDNFVMSFDEASISNNQSLEFDKFLSDTESSVYITNPNFSSNDTLMGKTSSWHLKNTLLNAIRENDGNDANNKAISENMRNYFGMNSKAYENGILSISTKKSKVTGRYEDLSPLSNINGPIDNSNYGIYNTLGAYQQFFESTPIDSTRTYITDNLNKNRFKVLEESANYIDSLGITVGREKIGDSQIRYIFKTLETHSSLDVNGSLYTYAEQENNSINDYVGSFNAGINYGLVTSFGQSKLTKEDLLKKTNDGFREGRYQTLISRFHTKNTDVSQNDTTQTAISKKYGMSKGRNLLKTKPDDSQGYDNPYCRVWTAHHQYSTLKDTIRPLQNDGTVMTQEVLEQEYGFSSIRTKDSISGTGGKRLDTYGVKNTVNGLVNISPNDKVDIKHCMFSIENLAWKGFTESLSKEQIGPFGGRIMWFPPYDLSFNESVSAQWGENTFIGRGEHIYTYANTTRSGTLKFKMLIDHPSILNYWNGKNHNESPSTVDDIDSAEQQLLRFFAGCDMLTPKEAKQSQDVQIIHDDIEPVPETVSAVFFIFFPNNYSGVDDSKGNTPQFPIDYVVNGLGSMKRSVKHDNVISIEDFGVDKSTNIYSTSAVTHDGNPPMKVGGYEVREGIGVSIVDTNFDIDSNFLTNVWSGESNASETQGSSAIRRKVSLFKQSAKSKAGYMNNWGYRVDNSWANEVLDVEDYIDSKSFKLNSGGQRDKICELYGVEEEQLYSLTDVYVALNGAGSASKLSGFYNVERVEKFKSLIDKYGIAQIKAVGYASTHGSTPNEEININRNNKLIFNRAKSAITWLKSFNSLKKVKGWDATTGTIPGPGEKTGDVSSLEAKIFRCAKVEITLKTEETKTAQQTLKEMCYVNPDGDRIQNVSLLKSSVGNDSKNWTLYESNNSNINAQADGTSPEDASTMKKGIASGATLDKNNEYVMTSENDAENKVNEDGISNIKDAVQEMYDAIDAIAPETSNETSGYNHDNESEFFRLLELNDPFMHHKITDKIKYFDPAFHSISPEGFNARLTFLHQCTRQGPTVGRSDMISKSANNLSFGRPPVCILRIGDFYYTKIIIKSLSINYDPNTWDLNTEGIGVMPMMASVDLTFEFIGGSDLAGPVSRLQNAISFNYYANTGVYDDRAEQVLYNEDGSLNKMKFFP